MQAELTRLRLYDKGIDGKPGFFTHQRLIEAFGGYEWVDQATVAQPGSSDTEDPSVADFGLGS